MSTWKKNGFEGLLNLVGQLQTLAMKAQEMHVKSTASRVLTLTKSLTHAKTMKMTIKQKKI